MSILEESGFAIYYIVGAPGAGKSYFIVRDLVGRRLIETDRSVITNLPLNVDRICEYVAGKRGCTTEEVAERMAERGFVEPILVRGRRQWRRLNRSPIVR